MVRKLNTKRLLFNVKEKEVFSISILGETEMDFFLLLVHFFV